MKHVHIIPKDRKFCLRAGIFQSFVGYQTAEAAKLPVKTRDARGFGLPCLDNLTKKQAEDFAGPLDRWLESVGAFQPPGRSRVGIKEGRMSEVEAKYREAMVNA